MYTFINIKIKDKDCWMLKLTNYEEVWEYIRFFAGRAWAGAKTCISRLEELKEISHLSPTDSEAIMLKVMAECEADEKGEYTFKPLQHTGKLVSMKLKLLMDLVKDRGEVIVNENGGCCDLSGFLNVHNATVAEEVNSKELVFPQELDKSRTFKLIILENDNELDYNYKKVVVSKSVKVITKLKTVSKEQILFYLESCEQVLTKTTFLNKEQVVGFLKMFARLKNKTIRIISGNFINLMEMVNTDDELGKLYDIVLSNNTVTCYTPDFQEHKLLFVLK